MRQGEEKGGVPTTTVMIYIACLMLQLLVMLTC